MDSPVQQRCFHCGEAVPVGARFPITVNDHEEPACCAGCQAVASLIIEGGLDRYYQFRESLAPRVPLDADRRLEAWRAVDRNPALWGVADENGRRELLLQVEGIHCAACAWLIRSSLSGLDGLDEVHVDVASGVVQLNWRPDPLRPSELAERLVEVGYMPQLPLPGAEERSRRDEHAASLKRVGVAGLGLMQVMMYAVALYAGEIQGISVPAQRFLEWVSLLVTTPVLLYSGRVFFSHAWRGLRAGQVVMDLPVALALAGAYTVSVYHFFSGQGPVWFDSVVMFIFFLSVARHVEMRLRHRNQSAGAALSRLLPEWAQRIEADGIETVLLNELRSGDTVRVHHGDVLPADGKLLSASAQLSESLLTGESHPVTRASGDTVIGGSINLGPVIDVRLERVGDDTVVSALGRTVRKLRATPVRRDSDRWAAWFIVAVFLLTAVTAIAWASIDPGRAFAVALSVLVVSCPCAFSLAIPSVSSAAGRALLQRGIVLTRPEALETLAEVRQALFDKTGTLTRGKPELASVSLNPDRPGLDQGEVLSIAAALEQYSQHPVAAAFQHIKPHPGLADVTETPGQGITGRLGDRHYHVGRRSFAAPDQPEPEGAGSQGAVWISDEQGWLACCTLEDALREGAAGLVDTWRAQGIRLEILSGDAPGAVTRTAQRLGIEHWQAALSPPEKLAQLERRRKQYGSAVMIGDGVNDAPVLAAADASMAVQGGSDLANCAADFILTDPNLAAADAALQTARSAVRKMRQNLAWAAGYNLGMIPLAALGFLQPWMAALGMSLSSVLVVVNASRLGRGTPAQAR